MSLVANWRGVLRRAWSIHLSVAACVMALLSGFDAAWPLLSGFIPISPVAFAVIAGLLSMAAIVSRLVYQAELHDEK